MLLGNKMLLAEPSIGWMTAGERQLLDRRPTA
jgi:hypothetical protein